jgi:hypothetical protein
MYAVEVVGRKVSNLESRFKPTATTVAPDSTSHWQSANPLAARGNGLANETSGKQQYTAL